MTNQVLTESKNISGIFSEAGARGLLSELERRNVQHSDVNVLMSKNTGNNVFKVDDANKAPEGMAVGGISGGLIGAIVGGLTLAGSVLAPGVGLLVAGPIVGALAGTAAGVSAGGILGGLIGMGIPENEAKYYEDALKQDGNMMVAVKTSKEMVSELRALFENYDGKNIHVTG